MLDRASIRAFAVAMAVALPTAVGGAQAAQAAEGYPDLSGGWARLGQANWDPDKPRGLGQQAPLTAEYRAIFEASLADQDHGGQGNDPGYRCRPHGMPRIMNANHPLFFAVTPETTYIFRDISNQARRIYTDGREWPANLQHSANGYSIGQWRDAEGRRGFDTLVVETRGLKNPHSYDSSGIPFHRDDAATIKERIYLDKANADILHDEVTTFDNALTHPWTVTRNYRRERDPKWAEYVCAEDNHHVVIGTEDYLLSADNQLMPTRKDQGPPDLRNFGQAAK
ncbi:MAG TPA: hypothetical protein VIY51_03365 [Xanthobacteraceae bacterium]